MASDRKYRELLREVSAEPGEGLDWAALCARLEQAAEMPLARRRETWGVIPIRRREVAWWEVAARGGGRVTIPLAVAASLAMAAYIGLHPVNASSGSASAGDAFEATVTGATSSQQVASLLVASSTDVYPVAASAGVDSQ